MKKSINLYPFLFILFLLGHSFAAIKSTRNNEIKFDSNSDGVPEMLLNDTGLGIGATSFSSNLFVEGNAIVTGQMIIGGGTNESGSNLHINGTIGYSILSYGVGGNAIGNASMVLADTSLGNVQIQLPDITSTSTRMITIKRTSLLNELSISGGGNMMDGFSTLVFNSGNLTSLSFYNDGSNWYIIKNMNNESLVEVGVGSDNLFMWWRLEETSGNTVADSSSNGTRVGLLTNELSFSGNSVSGATGLGLKLGNHEDSALYEAGSLPALYSYCLWTQYNHASSQSIEIEPEIEGSAGFIWASGNGLFHKSAYHKKVDGTYVTTPLTNDLTADTWNHIAVTWSGSNLSLYLNGVYQSGNIAATDWASGTNISLTNPGLFLDSVVKADDMRFYSNVLTADDVKSLYFAGRP